MGPSLITTQSNLYELYQFYSAHPTAYTNKPHVIDHQTTNQLHWPQPNLPWPHSNMVFQWPHVMFWPHWPQLFKTAPKHWPYIQYNQLLCPVSSLTILLFVVADAQSAWWTLQCLWNRAFQTFPPTVGSLLCLWLDLFERLVLLIWWINVVAV